MRFSFFFLVYSPRCYSPPSPHPFFSPPPEEKLPGAARLASSAATTMTIASGEEKVLVHLGPPPRAPNTQYDSELARLARVRATSGEIFMNIIFSWQYPRVTITSLRNSETGAARVLTSSALQCVVDGRTRPRPTLLS